MEPRIDVRPAQHYDVPTIHRLAHITWWSTYQDMLSADQIETMLNDMYSLESLKQQMDSGVRFVVAWQEKEPVGFMAYQAFPNPRVLRIEKLYVLPDKQGKGGGKALLHHAESFANSIQLEALELNVNRNNPAFGFYQRAGFHVRKEADIPYKQFVLNDYVMIKMLHNLS